MEHAIEDTTMLDNLLLEFTAPFGWLPTEVVVLRLLGAIVLGGLIGLEREWRHKPAGLRTHVLIALAASLFTLIALDMMAGLEAGNSALRVDPLRLIGAVTSGVAFLAAGAIVIHGKAVEGLTTGAGMWLAGAIGLACGAGNVPLAAFATAIALAVLGLLRVLE